MAESLEDGLAGRGLVGGALAAGRIGLAGWLKRREFPDAHSTCGLALCPAEVV